MYKSLPKEKIFFSEKWIVMVYGKEILYILNLLKTKKANITKITKKIKSFFVLILIPSLLDYKKQKYLYYNICLFVRDKFKDITYSKPIYY
jgi:hypothetical protein